MGWLYHLVISFFSYSCWWFHWQLPDYSMVDLRMTSWWPPTNQSGWWSPAVTSWMVILAGPRPHRPSSGRCCQPGGALGRLTQVWETGWNKRTGLWSVHRMGFTGKKSRKVSYSLISCKLMVVSWYVSWIFIYGGFLKLDIRLPSFQMVSWYFSGKPNGLIDEKCFGEFFVNGWCCFLLAVWPAGVSSPPFVFTFLQIASKNLLRIVRYSWMVDILLDTGYFIGY